jgi:hypothetical protein
MKKEILILLLLLLLAIPAVKDLFIPGAFTSHDLTHHIIRQISMDKLLSEGQFPPRWSGELNNGYGYPLFLFNYPLPAMVGEIFHKAGLGYADSVKAVLFFFTILSVLGMYLFLNSLLENKLSAFLGTIFYLYAPIRFLNVYVSAAVGSALALGILPFVFYFLVEIKKGKKWAILGGGLSFALLILAHNVTALIFAPVLALFGLLLGGRRYLKQVLVMAFLGLGLSAWFWLPALAEKQYTRFDQIYSQFYQDQFPTLLQLVHSPWGYGLSHPQNPESGDMSYQLGLIHIMVGIVFSLWFMVHGRKSKEKGLGYFVLGILIISVFLMLRVSLPFWENVPLLSLIQFPLRFSALFVFSASVATAILIKYLPGRRLIFVSLLILVLYANRNHWHINEVFNPGEKYYLNLKTTSTSYGEHLPKWGRNMDNPSPGKLEFIKGEGDIKILQDKSDQVLAMISATQSGVLRLNQTYFPGWEIEVNGKSVEFDYLKEGELYGLPVFDIPAGITQVKAEFGDTPLRQLADLVGLFSLITLLVLNFKLVYGKK